MDKELESETSPSCGVCFKHLTISYMQTYSGATILVNLLNSL